MNLLEEYERHEKQFESHFLLDEDADSRLSCFFRSFCSIETDHFLLVRTSLQNFPTES
jgi:hypothetical protein